MSSQIRRLYQEQGNPEAFFPPPNNMYWGKRGNELSVAFNN